MQKRVKTKLHNSQGYLEKNSILSHSMRNIKKEVLIYFYVVSSYHYKKIRVKSLYFKVSKCLALQMYKMGTLKIKQIF